MVIAMDFYELNEKMNEEYKPSQHFIDRAGDAYTQYVNQPIEDWLDSQGYLKNFIRRLGHGRVRTQFNIEDIEDVKSVYDKISGYQQYMGGMHDWLEMFDKLKRHLKELKAQEARPMGGSSQMRLGKARRDRTERYPNQTMRPDRDDDGGFWSVS